MKTNNKLRNALVTLVDLVDAWKDHLPPAIREGEVAKAIEKAEAALAEPMKNYEVGTSDEQWARYNRFCHTHECVNCPLFANKGCELSWAQMPYKEGESR